jgi:hypothetical protein
VRVGLRTLDVIVTAALTASLTTGAALAALGLPGTQTAVVAQAPSAVAGSAAEPVREPLPPPRPLPAPPIESRPPPPADPVAPLQTLHAADLLVTVPASLTPEQVGRLQGLPKVTGVAVLDVGTVQVAGQDARLVGVDPSTFRAFTPQQTAASDALWQVVAQGELAPSYGIAEQRMLELGTLATLEGPAPVTKRVGALASYGLPDIDLVTDRASARELGVAPGNAVLLSAPGHDIAALRKAVQAVVGGQPDVTVLRPDRPKRASTQGRPKSYRELYIDSARYCKGLDWRVLAAIGQVESGHGRNLGPSSAGALGPMQFLPSTWAAYGVDGDGDGNADILNPFDAVPSSALYLCRFGAGRGEQGLYDAIFAYNHADWYVRKVLDLAAQYR